MAQSAPGDNRPVLTGVARQLEKILAEAVQRRTAELDLAMAPGDAHQAEAYYQKWAQYQSRVLRGQELPEADRARYQQTFDVLIDSAPLQFEFYTKYLIVEPGFRQYLATEPKRVRDLLFHKQVEVPFVKCVACFFGLRFFGLDDSGASGALHAFAAEASGDLELEKQKLSPLRCPFDRFPQPVPDLLIAVKNGELKQAAQEQDALRKELQGKAAAEAELRGRVTALQSALDEAERKARRLATELEEKDQELAGERRRLLSARQACRVADRPDVVDITEGSFRIVVHASASAGEQPPAYVAGKEFRVTFGDPLAMELREVVDHQTGVFDLVVAVRRLGVFSVECIEADGRAVAGAPFSVTVQRDYTRIRGGRPLTATTFQGVWGLAVGEDGRVYVADTDAHQVLVFGEGGELVRTIACRAEGASLPFPRGVAVTREGEVAVVCNNIGRIQVFGPEGDEPRRVLGEPGTGAQQLLKPRGLCVCPGNAAGCELAVVDTNNHRVQLVGRDGEVVRSLGSRGKNVGQLFFPATVACFRERFVVTDCDNHRVSVLACESVGGPVVSATAFGVRGTGDGEFGRPTGVAVDAHGNILVADMDNNRIQVFDGAGAFLAKIGEGDELSGPRGVAVDAQGRIYVADFGHARVVVY